MNSLVNNTPLAFNTQITYKLINNYIDYITYKLELCTRLYTSNFIQIKNLIKQNVEILIYCKVIFMLIFYYSALNYILA